MKQEAPDMPKFESENAEAGWWASRAGRAYVKQKPAEAQARGEKPKGLSLIAKMTRKSSVQIATRLPEADLVKARKLAGRKGIGDQTLLKMLVHEGLAREARRG